MRFPSVPPGTIVVGVDGSHSSAQALLWGAEQATLERRPLTVVHAVGLIGVELADLAGVDEQETLATIEPERQRCLAQARSTVAAAFPLVDVQTLLSSLDARPTLLDLAERAAMVVVGSRGRGPVASLLLGSLSAAVARQASCPVVIARPRVDDGARRGVLVGVDGHGQSRTVVEFAYRQASLRSLPLTVVHCSFDVTSLRDGPVEIAHDTPGHEDERRAIEEAVSGMAEELPDVPVRLTLGRGLADTYLVDVARTMDMVVVGAHRDSAPLGAILDRNVDRSVLLHAQTVVAVVPEHAQARLETLTS